LFEKLDAERWLLLDAELKMNPNENVAVDTK
jgi:hypothetical protein